MAVDSRIVQAIQEAVREDGQSENLVRRLVAWFEALSSGNENNNDPDAAERHLDVLYNATEIDNCSGESD